MIVSSLVGVEIDKTQTKLTTSLSLESDSHFTILSYTAVHEDRVKHVIQSNLVGATDPEEAELAWEERLIEDDLEMQYDLLKEGTPQHTLFADERVAESKVKDHAPHLVPPEVEVELGTVDEEIWETIVICAAIAAVPMVPQLLGI